MKPGLLRIAVVGHTNAGKTSLLRTLTRQRHFGEVSDRPSTTRHVERALLSLHGQPALALFDTPGIEEPMEVLADLDQAPDARREDGPTRLRSFLARSARDGRFEQECKVLRQVLDSDAAFFVIDARSPVIAKYRDELEVLRLCGVPLLPLLNFTRSAQADESAWRRMLGNAGYHVLIAFDTVAPERGAETRLYSTLATFLPDHERLLHQYIAQQERTADERQRQALSQLAGLLLDAASWREPCESDDESAINRARETLNRSLQEREQRMINQLLTLYQFHEEDLQHSPLPLVDGRWQQDLFDPYTLQLLGLRLGGGAATGAAIGAGIDLMTGGLTLGTATATGALVGGGWQSLRHYGQRWLDQLSQRAPVLRVEDAIVRALALRGLLLIKALENRGHAATQRTQKAADTGRSLWPRNLPEPLRQARAHPEWLSETISELGPTSPAQRQATEALRRELGALLREVQDFMPPSMT